jgi:hypothetical protein
MKRYPVLLLAAALVGFLLPLGHAQQNVNPIDYTKQADVNKKTLTLGDVPFNTISQPTRDLPNRSPIAKGDLKLSGVDLKDMDLKTLEMNSVSTPVLPKTNFTGKRAAADKPNDLTKKQVDQTKQVAPITDRQIRPFTPGGEEELKKQLNDPH